MKIEDIKEICDEVTRLLCIMYKEDYENPHLKDKLIFPIKRQNKGEIPRISEQEFKLLFIQEMLGKSNEVYYSVETPTENKYKFPKDYDGEWYEGCGNGSYSRAALIDLTLYAVKDDRYNRLFNIEFKHNHHKYSLRKDVFKLVVEKTDGILIILVKNTDSGTLKSIHEKLKSDFEKFSEKWENDSKMIYVIVNIIEKQEILLSSISKNDVLNGKIVFQYK